jgi:UDP-N-acetylmuramate--alanine ligase
MGGLLPPHDLNARLGDGPLFLYEACEGYGSLDDVEAEVICVTSIDDDHVEHFGSLELLASSFTRYLARLPEDGAAVLCEDDPGVRRFLGEVSLRRKVAYGLTPGSDLQAVDLEQQGAVTRFRLLHHGRDSGHCALRTPGRHNVRNALAALAVAREVGVPFDVGVEALGRFTPVRRRFERLGRAAGRAVVDDYAHHPTEVAACLEAAKQLLGASGGRVVVLFQPHSYVRTASLYEGFAKALAPADVVLILSIYGGREEQIAGVSSRLVTNALLRRGHGACHDCEGHDEAIQRAIDLSRPGDLILTMGGGDVTRLGPRLLARLGGARTG